MEFELTEDYIELNKLLKLEGLVESGGAANNAILEGEVFVNNEQEFRKRRKLRKGDVVSIYDQKLAIT